MNLSLSNAVGKVLAGLVGATLLLAMAFIQDIQERWKRRGRMRLSVFNRSRVHSFDIGILYGIVSLHALWVRFPAFGHGGFQFKRTPLLFSERYGYRRYIPLPFGWRFLLLRKCRMNREGSAVSSHFDLDSLFG